jgi:hypothetical protein
MTTCCLPNESAIGIDFCSTMCCLIARSAASVNMMHWHRFEIIWAVGDLRPGNRARARELDDQARPAVELCRIAERVEQTYPKLAQARVITAERFADHPAAVGDPDRLAHRQYGITAASAYVVRPDGHIGYRGRPVDGDRVIADLAARLPGASPAAARQVNSVAPETL